MLHNLIDFIGPVLIEGAPRIVIGNEVGPNDVHHHFAGLVAFVFAHKQRQSPLVTLDVRSPPRFHNGEQLFVFLRLQARLDGAGQLGDALGIGGALNQQLLDFVRIVHQKDQQGDLAVLGG